MQLPESWTAALFKKFKTIYRERWTGKFENETEINEYRQEWGEALAGLNSEQMRIGLYRSRAEYKWPPNISEFIELAKSQDKNWQHKGAAYRIVVFNKPKTIN